MCLYAILYAFSQLNTDNNMSGLILSVQESIYWSMNMNPYKFGLSGPVTTCYYGSYEINDHFPRFEMDRSEWEYPSTIVVDEPTPTESSSGRDGVTSMQTIPEEC